MSNVALQHIEAAGPGRHHNPEHCEGGRYVSLRRSRWPGAEALLRTSRTGASSARLC